MSLSKQQLMEINDDLDQIWVKEKKHEITLEEAYMAALAQKERLTYKPNEKREPENEFRVSVWEKTNDLLKIYGVEKFETKRTEGCKFPKDSELDIAAYAKIADVKKAINQMSLNGTKELSPKELPYSKEMKKSKNKKGEETIVKFEDYVLVLLRILNDYGKYIDTEHPEIVKLYRAYHDKCLSNYEDYAKGLLTSRSENRDAALANKVSNNLAANKYTDPNKAQAVINLLQPVTK